MWYPGGKSIKEAVKIKLIGMHPGIHKQLQDFYREKIFGLPETETEKVCPGAGEDGNEPKRYGVMMRCRCL